MLTAQILLNLEADNLELTSIFLRFSKQMFIITFILKKNIANNLMLFMESGFSIKHKHINFANGMVFYLRTRMFYMHLANSRIREAFQLQMKCI